jgi:hypothetical protein
MSQTTEQVKTLLHKRLDEIRDEQRRLEQALRELGGGSKPAQRRRASGKRAPRGQRKEEFLAALAGGGTLKASEIAKKLGVTPNQIYGLARQLQRDKLIRKTKTGFKLRSPS